MTLEDISVLFGDPVELSFEQALGKEIGYSHEAENKTDTHVEHVETIDA